MHLTMVYFAVFCEFNILFAQCNGVICISGVSEAGTGVFDPAGADQ